ncbi:hypothetical protein [Enterococcus faecium]|uniref:hypothetical protein n=2 Tax=Enterococcus TaxID=1350 RepID=UPI0003305CCD|nr:hypothetical protein [Enterococcus faecium]EMF0585137.1 hypothetical protein [Enterococcus faecium]EOH43295.1 hypothetical protein SSG_02375 [Enterococcus faecium EnGen0190]
MRIEYLDERGSRRVAEDKDGLEIMLVQNGKIVVRYVKPSRKLRARVVDGKVVMEETESSGVIEIPVLKIIQKN